MTGEVTKSVLCLLPENNIQGLEEFRRKYINSPGKDVPFHITLLYNFYLPKELTKEEINLLKDIARITPKFEFLAKPLSSFPTTNVLYLTPTPATPLEELSQKLYEAFPKFDQGPGFPVFHMTIALGNEIEKTGKIVTEYVDSFSYKPLELVADKIGMFIQKDGKWEQYLCVNIGQ